MPPFLLSLLPFLGEKVLPRILPDKDKAEANRHDELTSRLEQFAAEFSARENRTWWDGVIDGLNRLPRPAMALGVLGLFGWASVDPAGFAVTAQSWALIPEEMWLILGAVVTFFFGDRTLQGLRKTRGPTAEQVREVIQNQREIAGIAGPAAPDTATVEAGGLPVTEERYAREMADTGAPLSNAVILEWNRRRRRMVG